MTDVYASRSRAEPEMAERCDPVLWAEAAPGPLGREQLVHYARHGFVVLPRLFNAGEVAALLVEMERLAYSELTAVILVIGALGFLLDLAARAVASRLSGGVSTRER